MKRACLTLITKERKREDGSVQPSIRYDAGSIHIGVRADDAGLVSTVTIVCSGFINTFDASDVDRIEFAEAGATWCFACDAPLSTIGQGIHDDRKKE